MSDLGTAMRDGILVDLEVRAWTGENQLTAADLGIEEDKIPKSFKLGKKPLVPPEILSAFKHQDYLVRNLLLNLSLPWKFGNARFVPVKNIVEFDTEFTKIQTEYNRLVDDLILNFDKYRFQMRTDFIDAAKNAHERLSQLTSFTTPVDQYINEFLARIEKKYPKVENIRARYGIRYDMCHQSMPDIAEMSIDDVAEDADKLKLLFEGYSKRRAKELAEYASIKVKYVRDMVDEVLTDVIGAMSQGKKFTGKTVNRILDMIERFKKINVADDEILEDALVSFKATYLDAYSADKIRESKDIQKNMLKDLTKIKEIVTNVEQINALADAYRNKSQA